MSYAEAFLRALIAVIGACAAAGVLHAAVPTFWQVSTEAEFLRGEVENLSIDSYGRLTLGPTSTPVYESSAPFLWTMVAAPDGSVYVGSGNEGQVYRIDAAGKGTVFFDAEELEVHAIAPAPGGGIYVGTSPDGKIYKVDASGQRHRVLRSARPLHLEPRRRSRGQRVRRHRRQGRHLQDLADGKGAPFYETKATHAMSLAFDREGRLLAGTESPGPRLPDRRRGQAVRPARLALQRNPHAAGRPERQRSTRPRVSGRPAASPASSPRPEPQQPAPQPIVSVSTEITGIAIVADTAAATAQHAVAAREPGAGDRRALPHHAGRRVGSGVGIARGHAVRRRLRAERRHPARRTGNKGKIYRLSGDPLQPTLVARANAQQVTTLLADRMGRMLFATSNPGKVFRLSPARAERGTYTSDVRDAQTVATWGAIKWQALAPAGTRVEISTRSGNTRTPDETWSDWSAAYANADGSPITSPRARYLQWRAVLAGARRVAAADVGDRGLPAAQHASARHVDHDSSRRARCSSGRSRPTRRSPASTATRPTAARRRNCLRAPAAAGGSPNLGRRAYQKGLLTFVWRAEDDNRDELSYDVLYRREGETAWKPLKRDLTDADPRVGHDLGAERPLPRARRRVRRAVELAGHGADRRDGEHDVRHRQHAADHHRHLGRAATARGSMIAFDVRDEYSAVQKADYSLDGDRWQAIYPKDGIADSRVEQFELVLEGEAAARGVIVCARPMR